MRQSVEKLNIAKLAEPDVIPFSVALGFRIRGDMTAFSVSCRA